MKEIQLTNGTARVYYKNEDDLDALDVNLLGIKKKTERVIEIMSDKQGSEPKYYLYLNEDGQMRYFETGTIGTLNDAELFNEFYAQARDDEKVERELDQIPIPLSIYRISYGNTIVERTIENKQPYKYQHSAYLTTRVFFDVCDRWDIDSIKDGIIHPTPSTLGDAYMKLEDAKHALADRLKKNIQRQEKAIQNNLAKLKALGLE